MLSILAGFMIAMGGIAYMSIGGIAGALFFSLGLITVLTFNLKLFTGKAGLLATREIKPKELVLIWIGNFIGAGICGLLAYATPLSQVLTQKAVGIIATRSQALPQVNLIYGIFCGLLMYIAVTGFKMTGNYLFAIAPVAFFILCGFNHCVADMFYTVMALGSPWHLIPTTIGNIIGCNIIPLSQWRGTQSNQKHN